jgi:hypothetical protein
MKKLTPAQKNALLYLMGDDDAHQPRQSTLAELAKRGLISDDDNLTAAGYSAIDEQSQAK